MGEWHSTTCGACVELYLSRTVTGSCTWGVLQADLSSMHLLIGRKCMFPYIPQQQLSLCLYRQSNTINLFHFVRTRWGSLYSLCHYLVGGQREVWSTQGPREFTFHTILNNSTFLDSLKLRALTIRHSKWCRCEALWGSALQVKSLQLVCDSFEFATTDEAGAVGFMYCKLICVNRRPFCRCRMCVYGGTARFIFTVSGSLWQA